MRCDRCATGRSCAPTSGVLTIARAAPVLLQRSPYGKSPGRGQHRRRGPRPAARGRARLRRRRSRTRAAAAPLTGSFDPFRHEADDGADTIALGCGAAVRSDGRSGCTAAPTSARRSCSPRRDAPPALRAIAPVVTASEYYEGWTYQGGALPARFVLFWTLSALAPAEHPANLPEAERAEAASALLAELLADPWRRRIAGCRSTTSAGSRS